MDQQCFRTMSKMRTTKIGIREFRSGLAEFLASASPVTVTRHGQTIGYFIPTQMHTDIDMAALKKASVEFDRLLAKRAVETRAAASDLRVTRKLGKGPQRKSVGNCR